MNSTNTFSKCSSSSVLDDFDFVTKTLPASIDADTIDHTDHHHSAHSPASLLKNGDAAAANGCATKRAKPSLRLPLNVIVTDHDDNSTKTDDTDDDDVDEDAAAAAAASHPDDGPSIAPNKTKKFYESDDTYLTKIFSQTITSTTVTPTDDDYSYNYDCSPAVATDSGKPIDVDTGSEQNSQTENLDNYRESLISSSAIDRYGDESRGGGIGGGGGGGCLDDNSEAAMASMENDFETADGLDETVRCTVDVDLHDPRSIENDDDDEVGDRVCDTLLMTTQKQRQPSIVVDMYNEATATPSGPRYEEPITPEADDCAEKALTATTPTSYFDQTIEVDDEDVDDGGVDVTGGETAASTPSSTDSDVGFGCVKNANDSCHCMRVHVSVNQVEWGGLFYFLFFFFLIWSVLSPFRCYVLLLLRYCVKSCRTKNNMCVHACALKV